MSKKKLDRYISKGKITSVKIKYDGETFIFDLAEELSINEDKINSELKDQPSYYGFMTMLQAKLLTIKEDLERQADKKYASVILKASETINPKTNRYFSDKAAVQKAMANDDYNDLKKRAIKAKQDYNIITACVRSFEQRATLIQSLSANMRKEV